MSIAITTGKRRESRHDYIYRLAAGTRRVTVTPVKENFECQDSTALSLRLPVADLGQ
jgi:hypothetical protein